MRQIIFFVFLFPVVVFSQNLSQGLVGYWPLNGNAVDHTGNGAPGTVFGASSVKDRNGNCDGALSFDGANDYIQIPGNNSIASLNALTISLWFKQNGGPNSGYHCLLDNDNTNLSDRIALFARSNQRLRFAYKDGTGNEDSNTYQGLLDGKWHHILVTKEANGTMHYYADGVSIGSKPANPGAAGTANVGFVFGARADIASHFLKGCLDEVRIYNRTMTVDEIEILAGCPADIPISSICGTIFCDNGNVGIGIADAHGYKLAVAGNIIAEEVEVELVDHWPDYVFESDYSLKTLEEVEEYITINKHLPDIPSEQEVADNGINLGDMDARLLRKIEELTLYVIRQNKEIKELHHEIRVLKKE